MTVTPNPFIPADAIPDIDAIFATLRSASCQIQRSVTGRSVGGAPLNSYENQGAPVTCRVKRAGLQATEARAGGRLASQADYEIRVDRGVSVPASGRIVVDGSATFDVIGSDADKTSGFEVSVYVTIPR